MAHNKHAIVVAFMFANCFIVFMFLYVTNGVTFETTPSDVILLPKRDGNIKSGVGGVNFDVNEPTITEDRQVDARPVDSQSDEGNFRGDKKDKDIKHGTDHLNVDKVRQTSRQTPRTVYNEQQVYKTALDIHNHFYKPPKNQTCEKRYPKIILVGVYKCGTRELMDFISVHPNIQIKTGPYEYGYFFRGNIENQNSRNEFLKQLPCIYDDQISFMKHAGYYSYAPAPEKIQKMDKDVKLLLMVREPVQRFISQVWFRYSKTRKQITLSSVTTMIEQAINNFSTKSFDNLSSNTSTQVRYVRPTVNSATNNKLMQEILTYSIYDEPFERYLKYFDRDQIHVIEAEDFKRKPADVLQNIESFLGLPKRITSDMYLFDEDKKHYCLKALDGTKVCYDSTRGKQYKKDINNSTKQRLKDFFRPHNERFFSLIGKRFDHWN